jgi:hypothetical protein
MSCAWGKSMSACPNCGSNDLSNITKQERIRTDAYPDVTFIDIAFLCENCDYTCNCVCAKSLNMSE